MNKDYEKRLGTDKILPLLLRMSLPAMAAQMVNMLYNVVDRIYIGRIEGVGTIALAGIGLTHATIALIGAFAFLISGGGSPLASMSLGAGNRDRAHRILGNGFVFLICSAFVASLLTYLFMDPILRASGASSDTLPFARDYLQIYLLGTVFVQLTMGLNSFISCQGRPKIAMLSVIIGAIVNIVLDPILIFGLGMGVRGAAIATVIAQLCSAVWVLKFLCSDKATLRIHLSYMKLDVRLLGSVIALGISPFVMMSTESVISFVLNNTLAQYGDIHISTLTILSNTVQFASVPLHGFALGLIPALSYNYGQGNDARVKSMIKLALVGMFVVNLIIMLACMSFPSYVARIFTRDAELIGMVKHVMPVFIAGMLIFGLQRACQNIFIALGQAKISLFIAILRKIILLVPLVLILSNYYGYMGVYAAEAIADGTAALLCTALFMYHIPRLLAKRAEQATPGECNERL